MAEFFRFLVERDLVTAAFIIGAVAFIFAIVGRFKTIFEPKAPERLLLGAFGAALMVSSYFASASTQPSPTLTPPPVATKAPDRATQSPILLPIATKPPDNPTSAPTPPILDCAFIDVLLAKGTVVQKLEENNGLSGVQLQLRSSVDMPLGWTMHKNGVAYTGPYHVDAGTVASFWAPDACKPLKPTQ